MPGRPLPSDEAAEARGFRGDECRRRRAVLRETIEVFEQADPQDKYHTLASRNLDRWRRQRAVVPTGLHVEVLPGDWGAVTHTMTARYGECFAVLNMANAYVPGGAYVEGASAQEENMFRRTDCHFRIGPDEYDPLADRYHRAKTSLLLAERGRVYLDTERHRVCVRGPEDRSRPDLGYPWLSEEEVFPFWELRAAAQDLRGGHAFNEEEARRRIAAQCDTLLENGVRHVVFGAFGCGAFKNPADPVAEIYRDVLRKHRADFTVVAFAIFHAGYGPNNYEPFAETMRGLEA